MTKTRRPKTLVVILIFFCWVEARTLGGMVLPNMSGSFLMYQALEQAWVHYALSLLTLAVVSTAIHYLWQPKAGWFEATLVALSYFCLTSVAGVWYTLQHQDVARDTYAASRTARGLPVTTERLDRLFTPEVLWGGTAAIIVGYLFMAVMAWRRRSYVTPTPHASNKSVSRQEHPGA